jgi:hypothetical protein
MEAKDLASILLPGELIPSASVWHVPGITPCVKTRANSNSIEYFSSAISMVAYEELIVLVRHSNPTRFAAYAHYTGRPRNKFLRRICAPPFSHSLASNRSPGCALSPAGLVMGFRTPALHQAASGAGGRRPKASREGNRGVLGTVAPQALCGFGGRGGRVSRWWAGGRWERPLHAASSGSSCRVRITGIYLVIHRNSSWLNFDA